MILCMPRIPLCGGFRIGVLKSDPPELIQEPLRPNEVKLFESPGHHRNWIDCIRSRQQPICDVEVGARTVSVCHLVNLAYYHNAHFKWDPKKEQFAGGTGDPKWLDVAHRSPWAIS